MLVLVWLTWARTPVERLGLDPRLQFVALPPLPQKQRAAYLGPFQLEGMWQLRTRNALFYGYSALVPERDGQLLAVNDNGGVIRFAPPGQRPYASAPMEIRFSKGVRSKSARDSESVMHDPVTGAYWLGLEGSNQIVRLDRAFHETGRVAPAGMRGWGVNTGPEAMARLPDGRFVAIREITTSIWEDRRHEAFVFDGDPIEHPVGRRFEFDAPDNFSVVDMTVLPDGRALILLRRLLWPLPMRFAGRIVIADTAQVQAGGVWRSLPVASLASVLPVDNFEGITAVPQPDGRLTVWLISDDNNMRTLQRTLLWKLSVDPRHLPWPRP